MFQMAIFHLMQHVLLTNIHQITLPRQNISLRPIWLIPLLYFCIFGGKSFFRHLGGLPLINLPNAVSLMFSQQDRQWFSAVARLVTSPQVWELLLF